MIASIVRQVMSLALSAVPSRTKFQMGVKETLSRLIYCVFYENGQVLALSLLHCLEIGRKDCQ